MKEMGRVILEMLIVAVVGLGFGLAANGIANTKKKPSGLHIGTDYFSVVNPAPKASPNSGEGPQPATLPTGGGTASMQSTSSPQADDATVQLIKEKGFAPIKYDEVVKLYNDPNFQNGAYVFVDGRNEEHYKAGHIPQAWRLDHFHLEQTIDTVLPIIQSADKVVLYCTGGNCEDSLMLAGDLQQRGIDVSRLHIYVGGIEEWTAKRQPVEKGERGSGDIAAGGGQ